MTKYTIRFRTSRGPSNLMIGRLSLEAEHSDDAIEELVRFLRVNGFPNIDPTDWVIDEIIPERMT